MSFMEKMDVLDLIIETLKEHEKVLDEIVYRLEAYLGDPKAGRTTPVDPPGDENDLEDWR
jgi:hypothetical protein